MLTKQCVPVVLFALALLAAGCSREARVEKHLQAGDQHFESERFEEAILEYRNAIQAGGQTTRAVGRIGQAYFTRKKPLNALPYLLQAVEINPADAESRLKLATILLVAGELDDARQHAEQVLTADTNNFEALRIWATASDTEEELDEAFRRVDAAEAASPDKAQFELLRGRLFVKRSDFAAAEAAFKAAGHLDPGAADANLLLGELYALRGQTNLANREFEVATQKAPASELGWFKWAEYKRRSGELDESKKLLTEMVDRDPGNVSAQYRLAQIAAADGDFTNALERLAVVLKQQPGFLLAHVAKAQIGLARGDISSTVAELERLRTRYPSYSQFHHLLAVAYAKSGNAVGALESARKAATLATNSHDAALLLAELQVRTGDHAGAVRTLEGLTARNPRLVSAHVLLGAANHAARNPAAAAAAFRQVTALLPNNERAFLYLGLTSLSANDRGAAAEAFERALSLNPGGFEALAKLVDLDVAARAYSDALNRIERQSPHAKPAALHFLRGKVYLAQSDFAQAETAYRNLIAAMPETPVGYQMLCQILSRTGRFKEAAAIIEEGLTKHPNDATSHTLAGTLYDGNLEDHAKARTHYERALTLNPNLPGVANNLAVLYLEPPRDLDKAKEMATRAYQLAPNNPAIHDTLGWVSFHRGEYDEAHRLLYKSATVITNHPEILYHFGLSECMLGQEKSGTATLRQALALSTNFPGAETAQATLAVLAIARERTQAADVPVLEKLLALVPGSAPAALRQAALEALQGNPETARASLESLLQRVPNQLLATLSLAELHASHFGNSERALQLARKARELSPSDPAMTHALGRVACDAGDFSWATVLLKESLAARPGDAEIQLDLAQASYGVGQTAEAERQAKAALTKLKGTDRGVETERFLRAIRLIDRPTEALAAREELARRVQAAPRDLLAQTAWAGVLCLEGNYTEARKTYEQLLTRSPGFIPGARQLAALCVDHLKEYARAQALAEGIRKQSPNDAAVPAILGKVAFHQGDYGNAIKYFQDYERKGPPDEEIKLMLERARTTPQPDR